MSLNHEIESKTLNERNVLYILFLKSWIHVLIINIYHTHWVIQTLSKVCLGLLCYLLRSATTEPRMRASFIAYQSLHT